MTQEAFISLWRSAHLYGGLTHAEIATGTDQPLGTITSRIRLGLQRLRYAVEDSGDARSQPRPARPALRLVDARC